MYAGVTYTDDDEDPYLTKGSFIFHQKAGFKKVAYYSKCGYKFGRWYDFIFMEKHIRKHITNPAPLIPFSELSKVDQIIENVLKENT